MLGPVLALLPYLPDAQVRGLDVPVIDPGAVQRDQGFQQVGAPPFEQVKREPFPLAEYLAERLVAGALQHQGRPTAHVDRSLDQPDQARVAEFGEHLRLIGEAAARLGVERDLQHPDRVGAGLGDCRGR